VPGSVRVLAFFWLTADEDTSSKGIMDASTVVLLLVSPVNFGLNIGLVHYTSLGIHGTPLAVSATFWLAFALLVLYTALSPMHARNRTWGGLHLMRALSMRGCLTFLQLAVPGVLMVGTEWCVARARSVFLKLTVPCRRAAFEIVALAAGRLGSTALAAQSVIMTSDQSACLPAGRSAALYGAPLTHDASFGLSSPQHDPVRYRYVELFCLDRAMLSWYDRCCCFDARWELDRESVGLWRAVCGTYVCAHERACRRRGYDCAARDERRVC
jgi:hypothetical protein